MADSSPPRPARLVTPTATTSSPAAPSASRQTQTYKKLQKVTAGARSYSKAQASNQKQVEEWMQLEQNEQDEQWEQDEQGIGALSQDGAITAQKEKQFTLCRVSQDPRRTTFVWPATGPMTLGNRSVNWAKVNMLVTSMKQEGKTCTNIWHQMRLSCTWAVFTQVVAYTMTTAAGMTDQGSDKSTEAEYLATFIENGKNAPDVTDKLTDFPLFVVPDSLRNNVVLEGGHHRREANSIILKELAASKNITLEDTFAETWFGRDMKLSEVKIEPVTNWGALILIQDPLGQPYNLPGLYTAEAIQLLQEVRANRVFIQHAAADGTIFISVRQGLKYITSEERQAMIQKGKQAGSDEKANVKFAKFVASCGFQEAAQNSASIQIFKRLLYSDLAPVFETLLEAAWVRSCFKLTWGKLALAARVDAYVSTLINEIIHGHNYLFKQHANALSEDDIKLLVQAYKHIDPEASEASQQELYQERLTKIMFPTREDIPSQPKRSDKASTDSADSPKDIGKGKGATRGAILHHGSPFNDMSFQDQQLSLATVKLPSNVSDEAIRRPGMLETLNTEDMLNVYKRLCLIPLITFKNVLYQPADLAEMFGKMLPALGQYFEFIYFLFKPQWQPEPPNTPKRLSMYDSLRDILIPKIVVDRNNLPDDDEEVEMEKHNMERDSQMISFCEQVRNMIETWLKKKADPNANRALQLAITTHNRKPDWHFEIDPEDAAYAFQEFTHSVQNGMLAPVLRQLLQSFPQCSLSLVEMGRHVPEILEKLDSALLPDHVNMLDEMRAVMQQPRLTQELWSTMYSPVMGIITGDLTALATYKMLAVCNYWLNRALKATNERVRIPETPAHLKELYRHLDNAADPSNLKDMVKALQADMKQHGLQLKSVGYRNLGRAILQRKLDHPFSLDGLDCPVFEVDRSPPAPNTELSPFKPTANLLPRKAVNPGVNTAPKKMKSSLRIQAGDEDSENETEAMRVHRQVHEQITGEPLVTPEPKSRKRNRRQPNDASTPTKRTKAGVSSDASTRKTRNKASVSSGPATNTSLLTSSASRFPFSNDPNSAWSVDRLNEIAHKYVQTGRVEEAVLDLVAVEQARTLKALLCPPHGRITDILGTYSAQEVAAIRSWITAMGSWLPSVSSRLSKTNLNKVFQAIILAEEDEE